MRQSGHIRILLLRSLPLGVIGEGVAVRCSAKNCFCRIAGGALVHRCQLASVPSVRPAVVGLYTAVSVVCNGLIIEACESIGGARAINVCILGGSSADRSGRVIILLRLGNITYIVIDIENRFAVMSVIFSCELTVAVVDIVVFVFCISIGLRIDAHPIVMVAAVIMGSDIIPVM